MMMIIIIVVVVDDDVIIVSCMAKYELREYLDFYEQH